ncbi:MAG TPA: ArsR family transcriptional regulator [Solirubrobacterales bacterium]
MAAAKTKQDKGVDQQLVHLVSHPVRVKALVVLVERTASPKEISFELREKLSTVSHHIRELLKMDLIELVKEERRRGAVEHFYRAVMRPIWSDEEWSELSTEERQRFSAWTMQLILTDVAEAMSAGTFNARGDTHTSRTPLYVDEQGWKELGQIQNEALDAILQVQATSSERMVNGSDEGIQASAAMLCIEMPAPKQRRSQ